VEEAEEKDWAMFSPRYVSQGFLQIPEIEVNRSKFPLSGNSGVASNIFKDASNIFKFHRRSFPGTRYAPVFLSHAALCLHCTSCASLSKLVKGSDYSLRGS
jgi:hypothetical protein